MLKKRTSYKYKAIKQDGEFIDGIVYAFDQKEAFAKILDKGYTPELIETTGMADKRAHERKKIDLEILFKFFGKKTNSQESRVTQKKQAGFSKNFYGVTQNISAGGLLFNTPQQLDVGTIINIILELPDADEKIKARCRVVRLYEIEQDVKYEIGASFIDLDEKAKKILNAKIRNISRRFERREYERFTEQIKLFFDFEKTELIEQPAAAVDASGSDMFSARTIDISAGGALLVCKQKVKKNDVLETEIKFEDDNRSINCLAKVVRIAEFSNDAGQWVQVAVFFLNMTNSDRNWINKYIIECNDHLEQEQETEDDQDSEPKENEQIKQDSDASDRGIDNNQTK